MFPSLHSRAISVILGDKWKKMKNEERRMYTMEAKALAEEQKRLNPDCWKRKRTNSVSTPVYKYFNLVALHNIFQASYWLGLTYICCFLFIGFPADLNPSPEPPAAGVCVFFFLAWRGCWSWQTAWCLFALLYSWDPNVMLNSLAFINFTHYSDKTEL